MKKLSLFTLFILLSRLLFSQAEVSNWYFGVHQYLKFVGDSAEVVELYYASPFHSSDNNSCVSDENGNFLFYSNGVALFNANLDTMPNGYLTGIYPSHVEAAQNVIVPRPGYANRYYVLVPGHFYTNTGLWYSEVDMSLDNGLGDVVQWQGNILLHNNVSEKVTAVYHANGKDIWIITHELYTNNFLCFLLTQEGIQGTPVVTSIGAIHVEPTIPNGYYDYVCKGEIKTSTDGRRLAIAMKGLNLVELYDFDTETGVVSNLVSLNLHDPVCLEFSTDGNVLYSSSEHNLLPGGDTTKIYQTNILASSNSAIINSSINIVGTPPNQNFFQGECPMQLASNDKIYFGCNYTNLPPVVGTIGQSHKLGDSCEVNHQEHIWPISYYGAHLHGFPNFFRSYLDKNIFATSACFGDSTMLYTKNSYLFDSIRWEILDPVNGLFTYSNQDTVYHVYSQAGQYDVHCFRYRDTLLDDFVKKIQVYPIIDLLASDTAVCEGQQVQLSVNAPGCVVEWHNVYGTYSYGPTASISFEGDYWPVITNYWGTCGDAIDTFHVDHINFFLELGPDIEDVCVTAPVDLYAVPYNVQNAIWSTGETSLLITATQSGLYSVTVSNGPCQASDQINISYDEVLEPDLGEDLISCDLDSVLLSMGVAANNYFWQPGGQTSSNVYATTSAQYIGVAANVCGSFTDTINVTIGSQPSLLAFTDTAFCTGDSLLIDIVIPDGTYLWSNGSIDPQLTITSSGLYMLTVSNLCGNAESAFNVFEEFPIDLNLADTLWLSSDSILIDPMINDDLLWSNGSTDDYIWLSDTGSYWLTAANSCGQAIDSFVVLQQLNTSSLEKQSISLFPNPSRDYVIIQFNKVFPGEIAIELYNMDGQLLKQIPVKETSNYLLNLSGLPAGFYLCRISSEAVSEQFKILKL